MKRRTNASIIIKKLFQSELRFQVLYTETYTRTNMKLPMKFRPYLLIFIRYYTRKIITSYYVVHELRTKFEHQHEN